MLVLLRRWIGSALFAVVMMALTVFFALAVLITAPLLNWMGRWRVCRAWIGCVLTSLRLLCGIRVVMRGLEHVPRHGPLIFLSNHQSAWETLAIPWLLRPRPLCFVFKRELLWIPFFGWAMACLRMIAINRAHGSAAFDQVKRLGGQRLQEGAAIVFFPEGTRVPPGQQRRYKTGGARLAIATHTPVVPVAHNAGLCWPKRSWLKNAGTITIEFGPVMPVAGHSADSLTQTVKTWIQSRAHSHFPEVPCTQLTVDDTTPPPAQANRLS